MALTAMAVALAAATAASYALATRANLAPSGVLEFGGGIQARATLSRSTCTSGPGEAIAITLADVGGWSSLDLTASTPQPGKHGLAKVSLQGTGDRDNAYAIAIWSWTKQESAHPNTQVRITGDGSAGEIDLKVPIAGVDDVSSLPPVVVAVTWKPGMCAASV